MVSQIGISMMVPVFLCSGIGYWLNQQFHVSYFFILMNGIGVGAAFRNLFMITAGFYKKESQKERKEIQYMEDLRTYSERHPEEDFSDVMEGKKKRYPDPKGPARS